MKKVFVMFLMLITNMVFGQHISNFTSVVPGTQTTDLILPSTHSFQYIIEEDDILTEGGLLPARPDFTGYVPINGSSTKGFLSINSEDSPGGVTILDIEWDFVNGKWITTMSEAVDFSPIGTIQNCGGTITPWGTVLTCQEALPGATLASGYKEYGWVIEIDPITKLTTWLYDIGNGKHENATFARMQTAPSRYDSVSKRVLYWGEDRGNGSVYKYVANNPEDLTNGTLYVLQADINTGTGQWINLNNTTPSDCNSTRTQAMNAGASLFQGVEDIEVSPINGMIYFAVKNEASIFRFRDDDFYAGGTISNFEVFVGGSPTTQYSINGIHEACGTGNDNLAFDDKGNLWVLQDGSRNHIWVIDSSHSSTNSQVRLFARTPNGCEPTGITFTPDNKFIFLSIMHPLATNNATSQPDAFGIPRTFNNDVVIAISLNENFGNTSLPIRNVELDVKNIQNVIKFNLTIDGEYDPYNEDVYLQKYINNVWIDDMNLSNRNWNNLYDNNPINGLNYYRVRVEDQDGNSIYSNVCQINYQSVSQVRYYYDTNGRSVNHVDPFKLYIYREGNMWFKTIRYDR